MNREQKKGHLAMLVASILWGLMAPVSKFVLDDGVVGSIAVADVRIFGAAVLFWIYSFFVPSEKVEKGDWLKLFGAAMLSIVFNQGVFVTGISMTSPVDASIITTVLPIVTMIFAAIFIKEPITGKKVGGVALGACGALVLIFGNYLLPGGAAGSAVGSSGSSGFVGNMLCVAAQCSYATYLVLFRDIICKYSPVTLMKWMFTFASLAMLPATGYIFFNTPWASVSAMDYYGLAFILLGGTFICYLIVPIGQKTLRPTLVAMYNYVQPIVATFVAIFWGMDTFNVMKVLAIVLVFSGVLLVNASKARHEDKA